VSELADRLEQRHGTVQELRALRCDDVDLAAGVIRVERGWDEKEGEIELKSRAGRRKFRSPRRYGTSWSSTGCARVERGPS
jgi:hypothetical protein